jgi:soluble lytic murein transglycosylase-like protein
MSIIAIEKHLRIVRNLKMKAGAVVILHLVVTILFGALLFFQKAKIDTERESMVLVKQRYEELSAKYQLLKFLRNKPLTISQGIDAAEVMVAECRAANQPYHIILAVIAEESQFDPTAISNKGARGLGQAMGETWKFYFTEKELQGKSFMHDVGLNVTFIIRHLSALQKQYGNDWQKALSAYLCGEPDGKIARSYVKAVLRRADQFKPYFVEE